MTNAQRSCALSPSPGTPGEGRGEGSVSPTRTVELYREECAARAPISDGGRWKFGFSLVVGSWTLALNLRIRTMNRAPLS